MNTASASVCAFPRKALWLLACFPKLLGHAHQRRLSPHGLTFEIRDPCDGKPTRTVRREERGPYAPDLPGSTNFI
jgi:hypothetical protein